MPNKKKPRANCLMCGKETAYAGYKYCTNVCQMEYQSVTYIKRWKTGEVSGLIALGVVSVHVKKYLRKKYGNKCCLCGWSEVNPKSGLVPVVADHIDGNWRNNKESNLRLLCPNCDSLSPTYAALNKGNGRTDRRVSKRSIEGQKYRTTIMRSKDKP